MNRRILLCLCSAASVFAADLPSPDAIMDRFIQVTGGKKAYDSRKSEYAKGTLEYPAMGIKGTIIRYSALPDKYYSTLDIEVLGKVEMGVNGTTAWESSAVLGPRIKAGEERAAAIREGALDAITAWKRFYPKAETAGIEKVDGEDCYKVVMTPPDGPPLNRYFQIKSGLEVKDTTTEVTQMGQIPVEVTVAEYKDFGGLLAPSKVTQKAGGQEFTITMEQIEGNPKIPPNLFNLPPDIKALQDKQPPEKR